MAFFARLVKLETHIMKFPVFLSYFQIAKRKLVFFSATA